MERYDQHLISVMQLHSTWVTICISAQGSSSSCTQWHHPQWEGADFLCLFSNGATHSLSGKSISTIAFADSVGINCHESKDLLVFILINTISIVSISFSNKTKTLSQHGELQLSMAASWAYWPHNILQSPVKCLHLTPPGLSPSPHSQKLEKEQELLGMKTGSSQLNAFIKNISQWDNAKIQLFARIFLSTQTSCYDAYEVTG